MRTRWGVTIVELLIVLTIISLMLAMLLPAVLYARERARETVCKNNLHQMDLAIWQYFEVHKKLPPPPLPGIVSGWSIEILPFLEQRNMKNSILPGTLISSASEILRRQPVILRCPMQPVDDSMANVIDRSNYVLVPHSGRKSIRLFDAPLSHSAPWVSGPEMEYETIIRLKGPHHGGFHFTNGSRERIGLMLNGEEIW